MTALVLSTSEPGNVELAREDGGTLLVVPIPGGGSIPTPVPVSDGGTGATILGAHNVLVGEGTSPVAGVAPGLAGTVLTSNGAGVDPSYQAGTPGPAGPAGTGTSIAATTNISTSGAIPAFGATPGIIRETIDMSTASQITRTLPAPGGATAPNGSVYWLKVINLHTTANLAPVLVQPSGGAPIEDPSNPFNASAPGFAPVACAYPGGNYIWQLNTARAWELLGFPQLPGTGL